MACRNSMRRPCLRAARPYHWLSAPMTVVRPRSKATRNIPIATAARIPLHKRRSWICMIRIVRCDSLRLGVWWRARPRWTNSRRLAGGLGRMAAKASLSSLSGAVRHRAPGCRVSSTKNFQRRAGSFTNRSISTSRVRPVPSHSDSQWWLRTASMKRVRSYHSIAISLAVKKITGEIFVALRRAAGSKNRVTR